MQPIFFFFEGIESLEKLSSLEAAQIINKIDLLKRSLDFKSNNSFVSPVSGTNLLTLMEVT